MRCVLVLLLLPISAFPAAFQNLNFEQATIPPTPVYGTGWTVDPSQAFPGWTVTASSTWYNTLLLSGSFAVLIGPNFPNGLDTMPLQGSYSAWLLYDSTLPGVMPSLSQTGLVPANARYVTFLMSPPPYGNDAQVSVNGQVLSLFDIGGGRVAGDISAFAGRSATLEFSPTREFASGFYFDDIRFSQVPEPGTWALLLFSALGAPFLYRRWAKKR